MTYNDGVIDALNIQNLVKRYWCCCKNLTNVDAFICHQWNTTPLVLSATSEFNSQDNIYLFITFLTNDTFWLLIVSKHSCERPYCT